MNNDQIISWIAHNAFVYLKPAVNQFLTTTQNADGISHLLSKVMERLCEVMEAHLKQKMAVILQDFVLFFPSLEGKAKNSKKMVLRFTPIGLFKNRVLTPFLQEGLQKGTQKVETQELCKEVASLLWMPQHVVKELIQIYLRALGDLVGAGRELSLNWRFCKLRLSRNNVECRFSQKIIKYIAGQQGNNQNKGSQKCRVKIQESERYVRNWQMIKQGNLLEYPSLREMEKHLQRGYNLQVKYKQRYG